MGRRPDPQRPVERKDQLGRKIRSHASKVPLHLPAGYGKNEEPVLHDVCVGGQPARVFYGGAAEGRGRESEARSRGAETEGRDRSAEGEGGHGAEAYGRGGGEKGRREAQKCLGETISYE